MAPFRIGRARHERTSTRGCCPRCPLYFADGAPHAGAEINDTITRSLQALILLFVFRLVIAPHRHGQGPRQARLTGLS